MGLLAVMLWPIFSPPGTHIAATLFALPFLAGFLLAHPATIDVLFYVGGGLKIVYDLLLYRSFVQNRPPEEGSISEKMDVRRS